MASRAFLSGSPIMRWVPTIAVTFAPLGWALCALGRASGNRTWQSVGDLRPILCMLAVTYLSMVQPRALNPTRDAPLDEREIVIWMRANARGVALTMIPLILICGYMSYAIDHGWWTPAADDWRGLSFVIICWLFGMPMAFANWATGAPIDEEDGE